jgi:hypothetical protein
MDTQDKYKAYGASHLFQDGRAMREPPAHTVQYGLSKESDEIYRGQDEFGNFITKFPVTLDKKLMKRGQERYNIFCAPCHDKSGGGKGMVAQRPGLVPPPSFIDSTDANGRRIIRCRWVRSSTPSPTARTRCRATARRSPPKTVGPSSPISGRSSVARTPA